MHLEGLLRAADVVDLGQQAAVYVVSGLFHVRALGSHSKPGGGHLHRTILAAECFSELVKRVLNARDLLVRLGEEFYCIDSRLL